MFMDPNFVLPEPLLHKDVASSKKLCSRGMIALLSLFIGFAFGISVLLSPTPHTHSQAVQNTDVTMAANPTATFDTTMGKMKAEIYLDRVPRTASNFIDLARTGFYNGIHFHRVIPGFMDQFGCPYAKDPKSPRAGTGGPPDGQFKNLKTGAMERRFNGGNIEDENISRDSNVPGTLSMANTGRPNTGGSQFFLNVADNKYLDWFASSPSNHPVFGKVIEGYDVAEAISKVRTSSDRPIEPIKMNSITIEGAPE